MLTLGTVAGMLASLLVGRDTKPLPCCCLDVDASFGAALVVFLKLGLAGAATGCVSAAAAPAFFEPFGRCPLALVWSSKKLVEKACLQQSHKP